MSYTPTTWVNGDQITATKLNKLEAGAQAAAATADAAAPATTAVTSTAVRTIVQVTAAAYAALGTKAANTLYVVVG